MVPGGMSDPLGVFGGSKGFVLEGSTDLSLAQEWRNYMECRGVAVCAQNLMTDQWWWNSYVYVESNNDEPARNWKARIGVNKNITEYTHPDLSRLPGCLSRVLSKPVLLPLHSQLSVVTSAPGGYTFPIARKHRKLIQKEVITSPLEGATMTTVVLDAGSGENKECGEEKEEEEGAREKKNKRTNLLLSVGLDLASGSMSRLDSMSGNPSFRTNRIRGRRCWPRAYLKFLTWWGKISTKREN